ncbi:MAG: hypothetical protein AB1714_13975 [Acidobacteriota bacterium]
MLEWLRWLDGIGWPWQDYQRWPLDDLVEQVIREPSLERKRKMWAEVTKRFCVDVWRACIDYSSRTPAHDTQTLVSAVFSAMVPRLRTERPALFTRMLMREMEERLDREAVEQVRPFICMRQFLHYLPPRQASDAALLLDHVFNWAAVAGEMRVQCEEANRRSAKAWHDLVTLLLSDFPDDELRERTGGVVNHAALRDRGVRP